MENIINKIKKLSDDIKRGDRGTVQFWYFIMIGVLLISFIWALLSETVLKPEYKRPALVNIQRTAHPVSNSISGVVSSASDLMGIMSIKSDIDSLVQKDSLSPSDSVKLLNALKQLEYINRKNN